MYSSTRVASPVDSCEGNSNFTVSSASLKVTVAAGESGKEKYMPPPVYAWFVLLSVFCLPSVRLPLSVPIVRQAWSNVNGLSATFRH